MPVRSLIASSGDSVKLTLYLVNNSSYQITFYINRKQKTISFNKNELLARQILKALSYDLDTNKLTLNDIVELSGKQIIKLYQQIDQPKLSLIESLKSETNKDLLSIFTDYINLVKSIKSKNTLREYQETLLFLSKLPKQALLLDNLSLLGNYALQAKTSKGKYGLESLHKRFKNISTALNYFKIKHESLKKQLPKTIKSKIEFYSQSEIKAILEAFKDNYYYPYVLFLINTGCRPEEALALRVNDIYIINDKVQITINKTFTCNELRPYTKNFLNRVIPVNPTLAGFLINYISGKSNDSLLFPSIKGLYINHSNFRARHFKPIIENLVKQDEVKKYLKPYALRHSFATNILKQGVNINTIAGLLGDNVQTVINNYIASDHENADIPDIY